MEERQYQKMSRVLDQVATERLAQHARFGEQSLPDGTGGYDGELAHARHLFEHHEGEGRLTYLDVLREEFFEVANETDEVLLRAELVQLAAVSCAFIEAIDRRGTHIINAILG